MEVNITKHAIQRYRQRLFDFRSSSSTIENKLKEIARKGKTMGLRLGACSNCFEVKYNGIFIVIIYNLDKIVVVTCLGDENYRKWIKSQEAFPRIKGRVLHSLFETVS